MSENLKRILVITVKDFNSGINKYRIIDPHIKLQNLFPKDFYVEIAEDFEILDIAKVKTFDAVFYHSALEQVEEVANQTALIKSIGVKLIVDIDDYWDYHPSHPYYFMAKKVKLKEKTLNGLRKADMVTTTSQYFADKIKSYNSNVVVVPNSVDLKEKQFIINNTNHSKINIGYVAGASHYEDIKLLRGVLSSLKNKSTQMQLCGFNTTKDKALNSTWHKMETEFTDNYRLKDPMFVEYLMTFNNDAYYNESEMEYKRVWTKPINSYMKAYDDLDICLAPLKESKFTSFKSNLKMLEAGSKKKPIVVSAVQPFNDGIHGVNCLKVEIAKEHKLWIKYVNQLVDSAQMRLDLGENLYQHVLDNFELSSTTAKRAEIYKNIWTAEKKIVSL